MKLRQLFHLLREGLRNTWQHRLMASASVGVLICCLMLTGFAYLIYVNVEAVFYYAVDQNTVAVFLEQDLTDAQVQKVGLQLESLDNVKIKEFISKEDFMDRFGDELTEGIVDSYEGDKNPMPNAYMITMKNLDLFQETLEDIQRIRGVEEASYDAGVASTLSQLRGVVLAIGGGIIGVLLVVSLFIIVNTIKLTVYNRRLEIYIMKSVGATDGYVRFPFVVEGWLLGVLAGGIGFGLISLLYRALADNLTTFKLVPFGEQWLPLLIGFLAGGMLVGVCGSAISIRKYLRQEGSVRS
ncbi:MAG: permease-like cell division protein FtsX [Oscillospiraceae bacterium]|nr:permease-like cell division protein FtsX [Oscillospiraceae bacterium]